MPEFFGNNYTNIGTTENPIYISTSSGGGGGEEIIFASFGVYGSANTGHTIGTYVDDRASGITIDPAKTYKFINIEYQNVSDNTSRIDYFITGAEPNVLSNINVNYSYVTLLGFGQKAYGYGTFWTYIYNNKLKVVVTSSRSDMYGLSGANFIHAAIQVT